MWPPKDVGIGRLVPVWQAQCITHPGATVYCPNIEQPPTIATEWFHPSISREVFQSEGVQTDKLEERKSNVSASRGAACAESQSETALYRIEPQSGVVRMTVALEQCRTRCCRNRARVDIRLTAAPPTGREFRPRDSARCARSHTRCRSASARAVNRARLRRFGCSRR